MDIKRLLMLMVGKVLLVSSLLACECTVPAAPKMAQDSADIIFSGRVIHQTTNWMSGGMKYTFVVDQFWKRRVDSILVVNTGFEQTDCGYAFAEGEQYLVYARKKFSVKTDRCSGTKLLAQAETDLEMLGPGEKPAPSPLLPMVSWSVIILPFLALVFVAIVVLRKRNVK